MKVLEVRHLSKRFGNADTLAVSDVSLAVTRGEVLAVVGESGSGKTTLLRLIAGLELPTGGEVLLNGHVASSPGRTVPPERRGVGIVFQDYALFPHLDVLQNVMFGLLTMGRTARRNRAIETLELVGLEDYAQRFPHELSGGQQQRVALARALAPRPSLLLLDEPFSNLDVVLKEQVREDVGRIVRAAGTTALFVVHDLDDVLSVADRIAILKDGTLQQIDTPQAIWKRPADSYVAQLFGATNLLPGSAVRGGFDTPIGFVAYDDAPVPGTRVLLAVRPHDLVVEPGGDVANAADVSEARGGATALVRDVRFRGGEHEIVLEVDAGSEERPLLLRARHAGYVRSGERVFVRLAASNPRIVGGAEID